ncbi:MAG: hypothetical protein ACRDQ7_11180, partial [Haloechinothrix sp.]
MSDTGDLFPSGAEWWRADAAGLVAGYQVLEALVRRAQAEQGRIAAEMHSRGMMATFGYAGLDKLLIDTVH